MNRDIDYEALGVTVLLRIRHDERYLKPVVESFSDGTVVGIEANSADLVIGLRTPAAAWPAAVCCVEQRLDALSVDWRPRASCRRP